MKKFFPLLILLILSVIISGCVQTEEEQEQPSVLFGKGRGLTITNYTSTRNSLSLKETTEIKINFKNIGDFQARNISAIIYGYGELEKVSEKPYIVEILPGLEDFMFWILKAEKLGSAITNYQINSRIYYLYNFSGYEQVSFIPEDYSGENPALSKQNAMSPLHVDLESGSPIRTISPEKTPCKKGECVGGLNDESGFCYDSFDNDGDGLTDCYDSDCTSSCGQEFSITIIIKNKGLGDVKYKENPKKAYKINNLIVQVPDSWIETFNVTGKTSEGSEVEIWEKTVKPEEDVITYALNYDKVSKLMDDSNCATGENSTLCTLLYSAMQDLWLVRGEETRIILSFRRPLVSDVTVDKVAVKGDFGYMVDTRDFGKTITIFVNQ